MMTRTLLICGLLLGSMAAATAAPMAVPSVTSSETITYQNPEVERPTYPNRPPQPPVTDCSQYPGTVAMGPNCIPVSVPGPTTTTINQPQGCAEWQVMRNGVCTNRNTGGGTPPPRPPLQPTNVLYPREVQTELQRVGCLAGRVDGIWGNGSRSSLRKFYERARLSAAGTEPTQVVLSDVQSQRGRICPAVYVQPKTPKKKKPTTTVKKTPNKYNCGKHGHYNEEIPGCECFNGTSWNGYTCAKPKQTTTKVHSDQASAQTVVDIISIFTDKPKKKEQEYTPKCYRSCDDEGRNCETVCE